MTRASAGAWAGAPVATPLPGVTLHGLWLDRVMLTRVALAPWADVPDHVHPADQIGTVLSGSLELRLAGAHHRLGPDMAYCVPGRTLHGGTAGPDGCVLLEAFGPSRPEYEMLLTPR